jgi:adenine deaminase
MSDSRRNFIKKSAVLAAATAAAHSSLAHFTPTESEEEVYDYVIENGEVFVDRKLKKLFVGINGFGKLKISSIPLKGQQIIDATGKIVSPGFIDILADNSSNPESTFTTFESYKVSDGVTTALQLHGGHDKAASFQKRVITSTGVFLPK